MSRVMPCDAPRPDAVLKYWETKLGCLRYPITSHVSIIYTLKITCKDHVLQNTPLIQVIRSPLTS